MKKISGILMLLIYVCVASTLLNDAFVSAYNMQNIARWSALFGILGIGVAFVIITGGIDLSIGSVVGLIGCILPMSLDVMEEHGPHWATAITFATLALLAFVIAFISLILRAFEDGVGQGLLVLLVPPYWIYFCTTRWQECRLAVNVTAGACVFLSVAAICLLVPMANWVAISLILISVMGFAMLLGLFHGTLITQLNLQPFVITLCGLLIYRGMARYITGDQTQGFGSGYDDSLRLFATGKPCSVAFVLLVAGALLAIWFCVRLVSQFSLPRNERRFGLQILGLLAGMTLAVIGSSRFWFGVELDTGNVVAEIFGLELKTWTAVVPEQGAQLPSELMWWIGLLFVPAGVVFVVIALAKSWRQVIIPLISFLLTTAIVTAIVIYGLPGLVSLVLEVTTGQPNLMSLGEPWDERWRMAEVFIGLGVFLGMLAWFVRSGLQAGGSAARLPFTVTAATAVLWLVGKTQVLRDYVPEDLHGLLGKTSIGETLVPAPFFILILVGVTAAIFLNLTIYGRYLLALGRNVEAARFSGINTDRMVILAYVICSGCAGLGAILFALDGNSVQPSGHGNFYELYAIAAAVLGGCSLRGGEGSILGVIIGAAVMRVLYNSINLLGIRSELEFSIIGIVILIGVIVDELVKRMAERRRASEEAREAENSA